MTLFALTYVRSILGRVIGEERAQDTFEYVLIIGGVSVAVIAAVATPVGSTLINAVVDGTCTAINGVVAVTCP